MSISGGTKVYGVVGDPVAHSLSPLIHNQWMRDLSVDAIYVPLRLTHDNPSGAIRSMVDMGFSGLNVTLPHKISALSAAQQISDTARAVGAANTLCLAPDHGWIAHNTDVEGFARAAENAAGARLDQLSIVLIGAGGAARAAAYYLGKAGAELAILNRTRATAESLAAEFAPAAQVAEMSELKKFSERADLVVNAASLGHSGATLPTLAAGEGRPFLDLSYGKAAAGVLRSAEQSGWQPHDGLAMLVAQAAAAFELWFSVSPDQASALRACREKLAVAP